MLTLDKRANAIVYIDIDQENNQMIDITNANPVLASLFEDEASRIAEIMRDKRNILLKQPSQNIRSWKVVKSVACLKVIVFHESEKNPPKIDRYSKLEFLDDPSSPRLLSKNFDSNGKKYEFIYSSGTNLFIMDNNIYIARFIKEENNIYSYAMNLAQ